MPAAAPPPELLRPEAFARLPPHARARTLRLLRAYARRHGAPEPPRPWPTDDPEVLLRAVAPMVATAPLGAHHRRFWDWVWRVQPGVRPEPLAALWSRGSAKSSSAELAAVLLGAHRRRKYVAYISNTQELANDHVASVSALLENPHLARAFPDMADRKVGKYGPKAWRRTRLQTASGFVIDAIGLDASARGRRVEEQRPDLICHVAGTRIYDTTLGRWTTVDQHPSHRGYCSQVGLRVHLWGLVEPETVTPEHRYWARTLKQQYVKGRATFPLQPADWVEAQDLRVSRRAAEGQKYQAGHWLGLPIDPSELPPQPIDVWQPGSGERDAASGRITGGGGLWAVEVPEEFADPEWWWFFGLWWGDGHADGRSVVGLTVANTAPHLSARVTALLDRYGIVWWRAEKPGCHQIMFARARLSRWLKGWRTGNAIKQPPEWVERASREFQRQLCRGYVDADGYVGRDQVRITSVNYDGLLCLRRILARLGIAASIRLGAKPRWELFSNGHRVLSRQKYDLRFALGAKALGLDIEEPSRYATSRTFVADGHLWTKVRKVEPTEGEEKFAPINTATRDYLTDFGRSHNCLDDVDSVEDSEATVRKKLRTLTSTLIPMGAPDVAIMFVQNLVHERSIARRIAYPGEFEPGERFLTGATVIGPVPAVEGLQYELVEQPGGRSRWAITAGEATWAGLPIEVCEDQLNDSTLDSFLREYQHDITPPPGGLFSHLSFKRVDATEVPWGAAATVETWCDPAVSATDRSDSMAFATGTVAVDGQVYVLEGFEQICSPAHLLERAVLSVLSHGGHTVGVETDQGGDLWELTFWRVADDMAATGRISEADRRRLVFRSEKAGSVGGKVERAQQMVHDYEHGWVSHVRGAHDTIERALYRFPLTKPFDQVDALYWLWRSLRTLVPVPTLGSQSETLGPRSGASEWAFGAERGSSPWAGASGPLSDAAPAAGWDLGDNGGAGSAGWDFGGGR